MVSVPSQYTDATSTVPDENKDVQHKPREKQKQNHHHRHHHHHHHKQKLIFRVLLMMKFLM